MELSREHFRAMIYYDFKCGLTQPNDFDFILLSNKNHPKLLLMTGLRNSNMDVLISDEFREGRPSTALLAAAMQEMIKEDRHVTYHEIEPTLGIHMTAIHANLHDNLEVKKLYTGSRNSTSYSIRWNSLPAPVTCLSKRIGRFVLGKLSVRRCKVQNLDVYEQMRNGVRYFDLQVCKKAVTANRTDGFYFCCGRYCDRIIQPLLLIRKYLEAYSHEFVILDFRKFYNMTHDDHDIVQDCIFNIFKGLIYGPRNGFLVELTLAKAAQMQKQVLLIYRHDDCWENAWPDCCWPILSVNIGNIEDLCGALEAKLRRRQPGIGYIAQYIYKPKSSDSRLCIALDVFSRIKDWIPKQSAGIVSLNNPRLNIITTDFVDMYDAVFCKEIVRLNDWSLLLTQIKENDEAFA